MNTTDFIVGIDLGTTNSVVSILQDKTPKTLLIDNAKLLPSVVSLTDNGFIVGQVAKNMAILEPDKTVLSIKRKMGQNITMKVGDKQMRPEEISALILKKIKQTVISELNLSAEQTVRAVITVPAYFTEEQRTATKQAAELAGLQVERIINEPTAAALAFGLSNMNEAVYAVYDLGGGTFDISIIESNKGLVEVLATTGDNQLGGDDFDHTLADFLWNKFLQTNKLPEAQPSKKEQARLLRIAEQTKIKLSSAEQVEVKENFFLKKGDQTYHLITTVTQEEFEGLIKDKVKQTVSLLEKAIEDAKLEWEELDGIILVGGSSRIPLVSQLIKEHFNIVPFLIDNPDEAVSHGATIQGAIIDNKEMDTILIDITPHSLGIAAMGSDDEKDNNPFSMLLGNNPSLHSAILIPKNTPVPVKKTRQFYSVVPFQEAYELKVSQGEAKKFEENRFVGETLMKIEKPVDRGVVDVTFELDINGILNVTAIEATTKERIKVQFNSSKGQTNFEEGALVEDAIITLDEADLNLIHRAEGLLTKEGISDEDKEELQELISRYRTQKEAGHKDEASDTETELLDLLYYLEDDDS